MQLTATQIAANLSSRMRQLDKIEELRTEVFDEIGELRSSLLESMQEGNYKTLASDGLVCSVRTQSSSKVVDQSEEGCRQERLARCRDRGAGRTRRQEGEGLMIDRTDPIYWGKLPHRTVQNTLETQRMPGESKRYSVWYSAGDAQRAGPDRASLDDAIIQYINLTSGGVGPKVNRWRIWDYGVGYHRNRPPTDITESTMNGSHLRYWYLEWDKHEDVRVQESNSFPSISKTMRRETDGTLRFVQVRMPLASAPTEESAREIIEKIFSIELPEPEEDEPRWWLWSDEKWSEAIIRQVAGSEGTSGDTSTARVWGTTNTRDQRRDELFAALKQAGPDRVEPNVYYMTGYSPRDAMIGNGNPFDEPVRTPLLPLKQYRVTVEEVRDDE